MTKSSSLSAHEEPTIRAVQNSSVQWQTFLQLVQPAVLLRPTPEEIARKQRALDAYTSQGSFTGIANVKESFRPVPAYDYTRRPHQDVLNYESWQWKMTGDQVSSAFEAYLAAQD